MTCIPGKNRITCYRTPINAKGRVKIKDGSEYWINIDKDVYDVLKTDAVIQMYEEDDIGLNYQHINKKYIKSYTKWSCSVIEYLQRLEDEVNKKCKEV